MNIVLIVPTGIGADIGGHAGDANPIAKLFGSVSDTLITHPNVLNASDINEMTANTLYVEGGALDRFLKGDIQLKRVYSNNILVAVNKPCSLADEKTMTNIINSVAAAKATIGCNIEILILETPLKMEAFLSPLTGKATGRIKGQKELISQVARYNFDALAISSKIDVDKVLAYKYLNSGCGVNPWGGVEAKLSREVGKIINKPVAHAPCGDTVDDYCEVVDPRLAAEMVSVSYLHCILKGLHTSPRQVKQGGISCGDVDVMISPDNCWGEPHEACVKANIPIIAVKENKTILKGVTMGPHTKVENYLEAVGVVVSKIAGVSLESVRRPLKRIKINNPTSYFEE